MFGKNKLASQQMTDGLHLRVQSVFATIQGEGPYAGYPALFIRLNGCNLKCTFCDTDFESTADQVPIQELVLKAKGYCGAHAQPLVVLTGGEPLLQNVIPLINALAAERIHTQIETAGTVWLEGLEMTDASIIVSPKTPKVHPMVAKFSMAWKYIIRVGYTDEHDGLPSMNTQGGSECRPLARPFGHEGTFKPDVFLQPCDEYKLGHRPVGDTQPGNPFEPTEVPDLASTKRNVDLAAQLCMKHGYRLSLQLHKLLGLP